MLIIHEPNYFCKNQKNKFKKKTQEKVQYNPNVVNFPTEK